MPQFHETGYGRKFFQSDLPRLISGIEALNKNLETLNAASGTELPEGFIKGKSSLVKEMAKELGMTAINLPHNGPK